MASTIEKWMAGKTSFRNPSSEVEKKLGLPEGYLAEKPNKLWAYLRADERDAELRETEEKKEEKPKRWKYYDGKRGTWLPWLPSKGSPEHFERGPWRVGWKDCATDRTGYFHENRDADDVVLSKFDALTTGIQFINGWLVREVE